jgi:hypothetical protein
MVHRIVPILGAIVWVAACSVEAVTASAINVDDRVSINCQSLGRSASACECVSREAHLRFTTAELAIIVGSADAGLESRVGTSGLSPAGQSSLIRRTNNADIVIRQSCGVPLLERPDNSRETTE